MTDKRQRATKVKCMCHESIKKTVNISRIYSSLEEAFEFCWSLFADEHKTLPKSTKRNVKSNKFAFGTLWLPDLLCKHWYTCASLIRNFCHWIADVLPCETSPVERSEEKRLFSQSIQNPRLSWITLHGTIIFRTAHHVVFWCSPCKHQLCRYSEGNF